MSNDWDDCREGYLNWAEEWPDKSGIKKLLLWNNFPIWLCTSLCLKDTVDENQWFNELHARIKRKRYEYFKPLSHVNVVLSILLLFIREILKTIILKIVLKKQNKKNKEYIWFNTLKYNLINNSGEIFDRMYDNIHLDDKNYQFESAFIIKIQFGFREFLNLKKFSSDLKNLGLDLNRHVDIIDSYISIKDIFYDYISILYNYFLFIFWYKKIDKNEININGSEFSDIFYQKMQVSFKTLIPDSLLYARMFRNWASKNENPTPRLVVTYAETLAPFRAVYFMTNYPKKLCKWISTQHSTIYKNKLGFYHRKGDFLSSANYSPAFFLPDLYLVHGNQSKKIIQEFYPPSKIAPIGCLKYDRLQKFKTNFPNPRPQRIENLYAATGGERILLLAPSVGDESVILKLFKGISRLPGWRIVLSKHPVVASKRIFSILKEHAIEIEILVPENISTLELMPFSDLVAASYSSIALESRLLGIPSIRVADADSAPLVDGESDIPILYSQQELFDYLDDFTKKKPQMDSKEMLLEFFGPFDGGVSKRFWDKIAEIHGSMRLEFNNV